MEHWDFISKIVKRRTGRGKAGDNVSSAVSFRKESWNADMISSALEDRIKLEASAKFPRETGGVLMGYHLPQEKQVVITAIIGPGPLANHGSSSFTPDHLYQIGEIASLYEASGREHTYLGDWHSHPRGRAVPSPTDLGVLARISLTASARCPEPLLLLIAGGRSWDLTFWQWKSVGGMEVVGPLQILRS